MAIPTLFWGLSAKYRSHILLKLNRECHSLSFQVDPTAVLGPNVTISAGVVIGGGVRIRESIVLEQATIHEHCCILYAIVGWNTVVGAYVRIEGIMTNLNVNQLSIDG